MWGADVSLLQQREATINEPLINLLASQPFLPPPLCPFVFCLHVPIKSQESFEALGRTGRNCALTPCPACRRGRAPSALAVARVLPRSDGRDPLAWAEPPLAVAGRVTCGEAFARLLLSSLPLSSRRLYWLSPGPSIVSHTVALRASCSRLPEAAAVVVASPALQLQSTPMTASLTPPEFNV